MIDVHICRKSSDHISLFRKDRPSDVVLSSAVVISHDMANLTWERHQGVTMIQQRDEGLPEIIPKS